MVALDPCLVHCDSDAGLAALELYLAYASHRRQRVKSSVVGNIENIYVEDATLRYFQRLLVTIVPAITRVSLVCEHLRVQGAALSVLEETSPIKPVDNGVKMKPHVRFLILFKQIDV